MATLDLAFLASGAWQHAFVRSAGGAAGGDDPEWVYKIPAAFGYVVPLRPRLHAFRPSRAHKRALHWLLLAPDRAAEWLGADAPSAPPRVRQALGRAAAGAQRVRDGVLAAYLRRDRRRRFLAMLDLLDELTRRGLGDVVLPYTVLRDAAASLRVDGAEIAYRGPILVQRRAAFFSGGRLHFESFDWRELVEAQQRLWRHGVAFSEQNQILGPMNWALLDGRLRLADTSSFTRDRRLARRLLDPVTLDAKERAVLARLDTAVVSPEEATRYFRLVRSEINQARFDAMWMKDGSRHPALGARRSALGLALPMAERREPHC